MIIKKMQNSQGEEPTYKKGGKTMKTKMKTLMKNQKGMTLIELLAVIVIIAIIALIAIPAIGSIINKSHDKAILSDASQVISAAKIAISDGACTDATDAAGKTTTTCSNTVLQKYVEGITLDKATDKVVKADSVYTITYNGFNKFKTDNFTTSTNVPSGATAISKSETGSTTDANLAKLMGSNK